MFRTRDRADPLHYLPARMLPANVVGQSESHLCDASDAARLSVSVHRDVVEPFLSLRAAAATAGFDLAIESGFRGFDRQLSIWNRKARGDLAVLDANARPLNIATLSEREVVFAILRWSALPGASRHHWGTDIDVYDAAAKPEGYQIELVPSEYDGEGMFATLSAWLDERIANRTSFGFFRPYDRDRSGIAPSLFDVLCKAPCRGCNFCPRAIVQGDDKGEPIVGLRPLNGTLQTIDELRAEWRRIADQPEADALAVKLIQFLFHIVGEQALEVGHLFLGSPPVLR